MYIIFYKCIFFLINDTYISRLYDKQALVELWEEYSEDNLNWISLDIFDLYFLFGLCPYEIDEPEEIWV